MNPNHGSPLRTFCSLAAAFAAGSAVSTLAADTGSTRPAPPASAFSRTSPASPPASATAPSAPATAPAPSAALPAATTVAPQRAVGVADPARPAQPGKPDYAIFLGTQQEFKNTALGWTFRIENVGKVAPAPEKKQAPAYPGAGWGGFPSNTAAQLVISVGQPCPQPKSWKPLESIDIPVLQPGTSVVLPQGLYTMPGEYTAKGCRFQAEIKGPAEDANAANNVMHMISKTAMLPDLKVVFGEYKGGPGGGIDVMNVGNAPAGPSTFHYECKTNDKDVHCNRVIDPWKAEVVLEVAVPALKPGESFPVKGSTPKGDTAVWKAWADRNGAVLESDESNNTLTGGNKNLLYTLNK